MKDDDAELTPPRKCIHCNGKVEAYQCKKCHALLCPNCFHFNSSYATSCEKCGFTLEP
ncbi:MAG: hypothetical protein ACFFCS_28520 [Candidatus Hodarchaeota archaeon]